MARAQSINHPSRSNEGDDDARESSRAREMDGTLLARGVGTHPRERVASMERARDGSVTRERREGARMDGCITDLVSEPGDDRARAEREDAREREGDARTRGNRAMSGVCASMTDVCVV